MQKRTVITFTGVRQVALETQPLRELHEEEVLVRNDVSAISAGTERACLLDLPNLADAPPGSFPKRLGYSGVGRVVATGSQVRQVKAGDRVLTHWGSIHADYNIIHQDNLIVIEDDALPSEHAVFAVIGSFSLNAVRKARLEIGQSAAVVGLGILGLFAVALCRLGGAGKVIGVDPDAARCAHALALGASDVADPGDADIAQSITQRTAGGANVVIEVTGQAIALKQALGYTARFGRVALLGCTRVSDVVIDYYQQVHRPGIELIGAHARARPLHDSRPNAWTWQDDARVLMQFMSDGRLAMQHLQQAGYNPRDAADVYAQLATGQGFPIGAVFNWKDWQ